MTCKLRNLSSSSEEPISEARLDHLKARLNHLGLTYYKIQAKEFLPAIPAWLLVVQSVSVRNTSLPVFKSASDCEATSFANYDIQRVQSCNMEGPIPSPSCLAAHCWPLAIYIVYWKARAQLCCVQGEEPVTRSQHSLLPGCQCPLRTTDLSICPGHKAKSRKVHRADSMHKRSREGKELRASSVWSALSDVLYLPSFPSEVRRWLA